MQRVIFRDKNSTATAAIYAHETNDFCIVAFTEPTQPVITHLEKFADLDDAVEAAAVFCELDIDAMHKCFPINDSVPL